MLMVGIAGTSLAAHEAAWLANPRIVGVILFARNYADRTQLAALIAAIRAAAPHPLLIAVDQEGGPVQRFADGFTRLPALARIGARYRSDRAEAIALAEAHAWLMASEVRALGVDLSFAPVLDLARGNRAIGERAFDTDPALVADLGAAYVRGMRLAGMAATVKHFPGHGSVREDTHFDHAVDVRPFAEIERDDLVPFAHAFDVGAEAVMMAHVTYPDVAPEPAGYSPIWIDGILRRRMGFRGVVFSDDIGMAAAVSAGATGARIDAHLDAGCDIVLACAPALVEDAIAAVAARPAPDAARFAILAGLVAPTWGALSANPQRQVFAAALAALDADTRVIA